MENAGDSGYILGSPNVSAQVKLITRWSRRTSIVLSDRQFSCLLLNLSLLFVVDVVCAGLPIQARLAVQIAMLLDWTAARRTFLLSILCIAAVCVLWRGDMWDILGDGVLATDGGDANV